MYKFGYHRLLHADSQVCCNHKERVQKKLFASLMSLPLWCRKCFLELLMFYFFKHNLALVLICV